VSLFSLYHNRTSSPTQPISLPRGREEAISLPANPIPPLRTHTKARPWQIGRSNFQLESKAPMHTNLHNNLFIIRCKASKRNIRPYLLKAPIREARTVCQTMARPKNKTEVVLISHRCCKVTCHRRHMAEHQIRAARSRLVWRSFPYLLLWRTILDMVEPGCMMASSEGIYRRDEL